MDVSDANLPSKPQTTISGMGLASDLGTDSIYDHLSNHPGLGEEKLLFYKDSIIALSQQVTDSKIYSNSQQEKAEQQYEIVALRD